MANTIQSFTGGCSTHRRKDVAFQFTVNGNKYSAAGSYISMGTSGSAEEKTISGEFYVGQGYRGCKACGNKHLYQCCHCGSFVCYDGNAHSNAVCPVCGKSSDVPKAKNDRICASSQRSQLQIMLAIDISGSMWGEPLKEVKNAAIHELVHKFPDAEFALVTFESYVRTVLNFTNDKAQIENAILSLNTGGGTNSPLGYIRNEFPKFVDRNGGKGRFLVVLTDGAWAGSDSDHISIAQRIQSEGVTIIAIGCAGANQSFLSSISSANGSIRVDGNNFGSAFASGAKIIGGQR